jgi:putative DNA primase/helicase
MSERGDIAASMPAVAAALLGEHNRKMSSRHELRWGNKGSLAVDLQKGAWFDHETGEGGGVLDLIRRERKCSTREALSFLESIGEAIPVVRDVKTQRPPQFDNKAAAVRVWQESQPIAGTLAERYLRGRGLTLALPDHSMRFHPRCPFGKDDEDRQVYLPAMVCLMRSVVNGEGLGVHRTALDAVTSYKIGRKMLGPCEGGAVMLGPLEGHDGALGVCEGIETGLAIMEAGHAPVWALGAAGKIARLPIIYNVRKLTTWVDYDEAGLAAAAECERRWQRAGLEVARMRPSQPGWDFLDELTALNAKRGENVG